jgi:ATP-dependent helicase HepA
VLLSSEVGCEGLDFQFCDGLVNYDLPWNPMRVEQRIGRIDRYGQKSETAAIYNLITPGTVDAEIYERCLFRIGVFRQALGGSEEILGKLTREIHAIAENLELTDEERAARLQQLADNEIRLVRNRPALEEAQTKLFGLTLPKQDEDMVKQASSFWLAPAMLANLVARYLESLG